MNTFAACKELIEKINELLHTDEFLNAHRLPNRFVRKGILSMYHVILYLLYTSKQSISINISNTRSEPPALEFPKVSKQAVSKARQGILPSLFMELFRLSVDHFYCSIPKRNMWRDRFNIFAVDGSRLSVPNSSSNFESFGEMFSKKNPNRRWSMALCSTIYDICNDVIVHGLIKPFLYSERSAALKHFEDLENLNLFKGSIIVFDRGYYSEAMFRYFANKGYFCIMRLKENYNLAKNCKGDCIQILKGDAKQDLCDIKVRVISIPLESGVTEYLATTVFDESITAVDFKELYFLRWSLESKYAELKNQFLLEEFSGATSTSIEQEFYINLLLSNMVSMIKSSADKEIEKTARPNNKYRYQANRAFIIARVKWFLSRYLSSDITIALLTEIYSDACVNRSQIQPGRKCPRNLRQSDKERKHFNNRKRVI